MKKFAFFLPQFHTIPENDEWWGQGFTEWTNVKKAQKLYRGHRQPKVPLNNNYYNLLDKKTVTWQTELMHEYKVDGLIYYHYYFKGKMLLEKPAENLLQWKDIDQPFFFCWANHSWNRSWRGSREVLLEQTYGTESDWEKHFQYLLPFFQDARYEKKDNKPLFMIFNTDFAEYKELIKYFDKRCIENGFNGLYTIETYWPTTTWEKALQQMGTENGALFFREPDFSKPISYNREQKNIFLRLRNKIRAYCKNKGVKSCVPKYNGNKVYDVMIDWQPDSNRIIRGLFFEWDNTPRHEERGYIITAPSKKQIFRYLDSIKNDEYVFINAWNEWAEGMILEPTEENGYKYLEWIKEWTDLDK